MSILSKDEGETKVQIRALTCTVRLCGYLKTLLYPYVMHMYVAASPRDRHGV